MDQTKPLDGQKYQSFHYTDVHRIEVTGARTKWKRIDISRSAAYSLWATNLDSRDVFSTIQLFENSVHTENENYICPLYFDFDSDESLMLALKDARKVFDFFATGFDLEDGVDVYYTGNRGFHITVDYRLFGISPSNYLVKIWRHVAESIVRKMEIKTFDRSVYSKRRMWRMENTQHGKTGLWKIKLEPGELSLSADKIKELAEEPRYVGDA